MEERTHLQYKKLVLLEHVLKYHTSSSVTPAACTLKDYT